MEKLIINAAITGMVLTQKDNPHLPCTIKEIIEEVKCCRNAGASIVHVHARDENQRPAYQREIYRELFLGIRAECPDMIISGSASGRICPELEKRCEVFDPGGNVRPDMGSLTLGSLNFPRQASVNEPQVIQGLANRMNELGIVPEWEIFDFGMVDYAKFLIQRGILKKPFYCNILLGSLGTLAATPQNLAQIVQALPEGTTWSAAGIGRFQFQTNCLAVAMGGHIRVGLEDNLWYDSQRTKLATNASLIERMVRVAGCMERDIATPDEAREIIGLPSRKLSSPKTMRIVEINSKESASACDGCSRSLS